MRFVFILMAIVLCTCFKLISNEPAINSHHDADPPLASCEKDYGFDDILLVVHYNHPYYQTSEFIQGLYSCFPNIVFYGPIPGNNIIDIPTHEGHFLSRVIQDVLNRFPNYRGYLVIQDDVLMNFWNFSRLSKDKIWFAVSFYRSPMIMKQTPPSWESNFDKSVAYKEFFLPARDKWWGRWGDYQAIDEARKRLEAKDLKMMRKSIKGSIAAGMVCDMFYIPSKFREDSIRLSHVFKDVFCEVAIPTMLCCLETPENWEILKGIWQFGYGGNFSESMKYFNASADWVHAFKFSTKEIRDFAQEIVKSHQK